MKIEKNLFEIASKHTISYINVQCVNNRWFWDLETNIATNIKIYQNFF